VEKEKKDHEPTWKESSDWRHNFIADPETHHEKIVGAWFTTEQKDGQSVREYSGDLSVIHATLPHELSEIWKINKLTHSISFELQQELRMYPVEGKTYEAAVQHLQRLESRMITKNTRGNRTGINSHHRRGNLSSSTERENQYQKRDTQYQRGRRRSARFPTTSNRQVGEKKKRDEGPGNVFCYNCRTVMNHIAKYCPHPAKRKSQRR
jgi:hypothetical protein